MSQRTCRLQIVVAFFFASSCCFAGEALYQFNGDLTCETGQPDAVPGDQAPGGGPSVTFEAATIGGEEASVATLGGNTNLSLNPDFAPNGGGDYVNDYTIVVDMAVPARGDDCSGGWVSFFQTNDTNSNDGEAFINPGGGVGISGDYEGCIDGGWHRIAICVSGDPALMQCYVDGALVNEVNLDGVDGRWSLYNNVSGGADGFQGIYLFGDESGDVPPEIVVNSVLLVDRRLSADDIACLGGPTAAGIPVVCIANDDCSDAIALGVPSTTEGSSVGAAPDATPSCGTSDADSPAVWYSFTGTGGEVLVSLCGAPTDYDTKVLVFDGDCDALNCVAGNDDNCPGFKSSVAVATTADTEYLIKVFGFGSGSGNFELVLDGPPAVPDNDDCADAIAVGDAFPATFEGNTRSAAPDNTGGCGATEAPAVWYSVVGTGLEIVAELCGSEYDTKLSVYEGDCGALVCVGDNDDACGLQSRLGWESVEGVEYLICVFGFGSSSGNYTLTVDGPAATPANDDCADAIAVGDAFPATFEGSTVFANPDNTGGCGATDAPAVWYSAVGTGSTMTAALCGSDYDTKISVYEGDCAALTCVTENDDACGLQSQVAWSSTGGTSYLICVFGFATRSGNYVLTVDSLLECANNDVCDSAVTLDFSKGPTATVSGFTTPCNTDPENDDCGDSDAPGLWYKLSGNGATISASTCATADYDTRISVFSGECGALVCVAQNDDGAGCPAFTSFVEWQSEIGEDYRLLVHGFSSSSGNFDLTVERPTPPCIRILGCQADSNDGSITVDWESLAVGQEGFEIWSNGAVAASVGPDDRSASWTPELAADRLNDFYLTVAVTGDAVENCEGGEASCTVWLSPGNICLADNFESYESDADVELAGYFFLDENDPIEDSTWTVTNPGGRANPPTVDGSPSHGSFLISDSDAQGGSNVQGSGQSHDVWTPSFDATDKDAVWLHADVSAQLNNNGTAVFDIDVSVDGGGTWTNSYRRVAPCRLPGDPCASEGGLADMAPHADASNADGFFGRLDVDLTAAAAGQADVKVRIRHFEPDFDWWIAVDNLVIDDVPALDTGSDSVSVVGVVAFDGSGGWNTTSALGNSGCETWHTQDKGGRRNAPDQIRERGANRLSAGPTADDYGACLSGSQQVPAVASDATGFGFFTYDPATQIAAIHIEFDEAALSSPQTGAHIHLAPRGENGDIALELPSGSPIDAEVELDTQTLLALNLGQFYVNIHTEDNPGGEIRGQIEPNAGFAIMESDANPDPAEDETLTVGPYDLSEMETVILGFKSETIVSGTVQEVLLSLDGGETFLDRPLFSYRSGALVDTGEEPFYAERTLVVPEAAGQANVVFGFRWESGGNAWWWAIDDITVAGVASVTGGRQLACDFNGDGTLDISDPTAVLSHLFTGGAPPVCGGSLDHPSAIALLDANLDGEIDISDAVWKLNYLFLGGPEPMNASEECLVLEECEDVCA